MNEKEMKKDHFKEAITALFDEDFDIAVSCLIDGFLSNEENGKTFMGEYYEYLEGLKKNSGKDLPK